MLCDTRCDFMERILLLQVIWSLVTVSQGGVKNCELSPDCGDREGRSLCYQRCCWRDIPCNKDNDCFFYGASDISVGFPLPRCYVNPEADLQQHGSYGYGICMAYVNTDHLQRIPGSDVLY